MFSMLALMEFRPTAYIPSKSVIQPLGAPRETPQIGLMGSGEGATTGIS